MKPMTTDVRVRKLKKTAFWAIVCAGLISGAFIAIDEVMNRPLTGIVIGMGQGPVRIFHTLDSETRQFSEMRVSRDGGDPFYVTAIDSAKDAEYLMLASTDTPYTNVYRRLGDGSLQQITDSESLKYDLSVDAESGTIAYVTSSATSTNALMRENGGNITLFDMAAATERVLGVGSEPVFLSSTELVYRSEGSLVYRDLETSEPMPLIALPPYPKSGVGTVYAVNAAEREVALYDNGSKRIDIFVLEEGQLTPSRSFSTIIAPDVLAYAGQKLTWGSVITLGETRSFLFSQEGTHRTARATAAGSSPLGYPISLYVTNN